MSGSAPRRSALRRALSYPDARLFFAASLTAWTGLWVQRIAVSWLAWEMTGSAFWVGMVAFCDLAPAVLLSPVAGAVADRTDRVRLTMVAQAGIAAQSALIATLLTAGELTIGPLLVLECAGGIAASFLQPARQTLIPGLVPPADLPAAVACNSLCFNVARFIGPALAAPLIAGGETAIAIWLNCGAYLVALATLPFLHLTAAQRRGHAPTASLWRETAAGLSYARRHPGLGPILLYAATAAALMRGVQEILPPYVERLFHRGPEALAWLTACFGAGALLAGLWVANRGRLTGTTRLAVWAVAAQALATVGFVATGWLPLALACAGVIGAAGSVHGIAVQTLVQSAADPAMRGRMLSLWGLVVRACPALGALTLGAAGEAFGLRLPTLLAMLLALGVFAIGLARLPRITAALEPPRDGRT